MRRRELKVGAPAWHRESGKYLGVIESVGVALVHIVSADGSPANRTKQHRRDRPPYSLCETRFLPGRLRFDRPGWTPGPKGNRPPFGCVLLTWRRADG